MDQRFKQTIAIFLFILVIFITGCAVNGEQPAPKPIQTSDSEITNDPQDDIVYVDYETESIARTIRIARNYLDLSDDDKDFQETLAGIVEEMADFYKGDVRDKFMEVSKYIRLSDKEQVRKLCDEIEAAYVTKYSWKRDS